MATNNDIITREKLYQYDKASHLETWEEASRSIDTLVLGEMDWYLIGGIINDYLFVTGKQAEKFEKTLSKVCNANQQTIDHLKEIADGFELVDTEEIANDEIITAKKISFFKEIMHLQWSDIKDLNPKVFGLSDWNLLNEFTHSYFKATQIDKSIKDKRIIHKELRLICDNKVTIEIFKEMVSDLELKE
jgi:hypothetical protein